MSDTATDGVVAGLNSCIHALAAAGASIAVGKHEAAREHMKKANQELTLLRVAYDKILGPKHLPAAKRGR